MFYSQFILAKKGPLGTIWIAAHLERKLRKNQVADTDIGFSVDSILFPDVPIALRLSSHLLLGVVRIYSRKVNYLFDDCSEALLKIKQAFRSTAVDLPPEESTAPYHSITLPETFDLDDFELPDNDMFQGNYVDHHISSREQITLQDTMEGVVFSTSQFGLDERFGDGDASQIGLDIDEDLFLRKVASRGNDGDPKEIDETFEGIPGTSAIMEGYDIDDQNAIPAAISEAPEQLVGCMSPLDADKTLPSEDLMESEDHELKTDKRKSSDQATVPNSEDNGFLLGDVEMNQVVPERHLASSMEVTREGASENVSLSVSTEHGKTLISVPECSNGHLSAMNGPDMHKPEAVECAETDVLTNNGAGASLIDRTDAESPSCSQVTTELDDTGRRTCSVDIEFQNNMGESCSPTNKIASSICPSESPDRPEVVNVEARTFQELKETDSTHERVEFPGLRACNSSKQIDVPSFREEESTDVTEPGIDKRHVPEEVGRRKLDSEIDNFPSRENLLENVERSEASEIPAPEKLLAVSEGLFSKQSDLVMESTPEKEVCGNDDNGAGDKLMSGKKRSFTESTLTVHSLYSSESFSMNKSRRTAESIPGDDDLLSSILVGRKSSILKLKPTPSAPEIASRKRLRSAPRSSSSKRKVVMDDMMVLHGDTIRLQLTNTEDIRRIRKKAPCTRPEISMIQRQFEEEIFSEPIFTGVSAKLVSLHRETFDFSTIKTTENDQEDLVELAKDKESSNAVRNETDMQDDHTCIQTENQHAEISGVRSEQEILNNADKVDIDRQNFEVTDVADHNVLGPELSLQNDPIFNDLAEDITADILRPSLVVTNQDADASAMSPQKIDTELVELENIHATEAVENIDRDNGSAFETASLGTVGCAVISVNESVDGFENNNLTAVNPEASGVGFDEKDLASLCPRDEEIKEGTSFSLEPAINVENAMMDEGENADFKEADLARAMNTEITAVSSVPEFLGDFEDVTIGNDTEFLNVDDDEVAEDDEDYMPGSEDTRLPENTGWSSRTRAVSKYLQILFDKEPLHGRRVLAMDNLLTGKTRKEASRMFFETLVLKTKDYIHVEQPNAFDNILVKPKTKLMKADF